MAIGGQSLQEYLVSLGVKVDDRGFGKFSNALKSSKVAVMGITGAMAAMAVGIMKASQSITDAAVKYEDMGKKAGKSASEIAKQEIALQAMGKTLQEVNKNERLKKTYEDLKKLGGEIGLPKAGEGRKQITGIGEELSKLKVTAIYAMQWINEEFLNRLAAPLAELRKSLKELREKIMEHLPKISQKIGGFFAGFIRLIGAGVKGVADLAKWIGGLPDIVLKAVGAFGGMWAMLKASPIFWILGGLTALLLLLDDFYTYKRGGKSALPGLWDGIEKGNLGDTIFGALEKSLDGFEKKLDNFLKIGDKVAGKILEGITKFDFKDSGEQTGGFINKLLGKLLNIVDTNGKGTTFATTIADILLKLGTGIGQWLIGAINTIDWAGLGLSLGGMVTGLATWITDQLTKTGKEGGIIDTAATLIQSVGDAIGGLIVGAISGIKWGDLISGTLNAADSIWKGITTALFGSPAEWDLEGNNIIKEAKPGILGTASNIIGSVFDALTGAVNDIKWADIGTKFGGFVKDLFAKIGGFLKNEEGKEGGGTFGSIVGFGKSIVGGLIDAISAAFSSVNPAELATEAMRLIESLMNLFTKPFEEGDEGKSLGEKITQGIIDAIVWTGTFLITFADNLLKSFNDGGAGEKFVEVGLQIGLAILRGLYNGLGDLAVKLIFGEEEMKAVQRARADADRARSQGQVGYDANTGRLYSSSDVANYAYGIHQNRQVYHQIKPESQTPEVQEFLKAVSDVWYRSGIQFQGLLGTTQQKNRPEYRMESYANQQNPREVEMENKIYERLRTASANQNPEALRFYGAEIARYQEYMKKGERMRGLGVLYGAEKEGNELFGESGVPAKVNVVPDPQSMQDTKQTVQEFADTTGKESPIVVPVVIGTIQQEGAGDYFSPNWDINNQTYVEGDPGYQWGNALGGRYSKPGMTTISEHGQTEYVIPLNRPERARGLILQMFAEMGSGARGILDALGVRGGGGRGPSFSGIDSRLAMAGAYASGGGGYMKQNSDNTVTASPIINVYGSSDPVMTGRVAYDAAEQSLMRHIRGVLGQ